MNLQGKSAIVTGASLGIGLAITRSLVSRGVRVTGIARDAARLRTLSEQFGESFHPLPCDLGSPGQVTRAFAEVRGKLNSIDILVNNAGVGRFGAVDRMTNDDWDEMLATNVSGLYHCIREVVPVMKAQGAGHIVNIASIAGMVGYANASGYNATKFAVRGLSEALRKELEDFGIRVSAIYPGATDTMFSGGHVDAGNPVISPVDIAGLVLHVLEHSSDCLVSEVVVRPVPRKPSAGRT